MIANVEKYFSSIPIKELKNMKRKFDELYANGDETELNDWEYDILVEVIEKKDKNYIPSIGFQVHSRNRVKLPYNLGSLDKLKSEELIKRWVEKTDEKTDYMIMSKLDGISALLTNEYNETHLYTRGDGFEGGDITHMIKFLKLPKLDFSISIRGEIIMKKTIFQERYSHEKSNARNMVAGLVNSKADNDSMNDLEFIAYEIIDASFEEPSVKVQLERLNQFGFKVVKHEIVNQINIQTLVNLLNNFKHKEEFDIDGVVVQKNIPYIRVSSGNPGYAFAFKMLGETKEVIVNQIEWNISKSGKLIPRVWFNQIQLSGVLVEKTTGFNAKFIVDNSIGPGAEITITRSGDVIPYIVNVIKPSQPQMPDFPYNWDATHTNIRAVQNSNEDNCKIHVKIIENFFNHLGIKDVKEQRIKKLYDNGYGTLLSIISAEKDDIVRILGKVSGEKTFENISAGIKNATIPMIIGASGILGNGIGELLTKKLFDDFPMILMEYKEMNIEELVEKISRINGFAEKTARLIAGNIKWADKLIREISKIVSLKRNTLDSLTKKLDSQIFVMSGFRDQLLKKAIEYNGGRVSSSISKNTTGLIVKDKNDITTKISSAIKLGIKIYEKTEFEELYFPEE